MRSPLLLAAAAALAIAGCDNIPIGQDRQAESSDPRAAKQLREALKDAPKHGLTIDLFYKGDLESATDSDLRNAVLSYASALAMGKVDPAKLRDVYTVPRPKVDVRAGFEQALAQGKLGEWLDSLAPKTAEYQALSQAFVHYVDLASKTPDTNLPQGEPMKQGMRDPRVPALVEALKAGGYMQPAARQQEQAQSRGDQPQPEAAGDVYTAEVAAAVKRMQQDFGLKPDGIVGGDTLKAVNISARDRARQLAVALERLRWLERNPPATRIDVNTAATFLSYFRDGQLRDQRRVVTGQPGWETPQLGSPIFQLVANPSWNVPESIEKDELSKKPASYFRAQNIVRKDGRYVQLPGPKNALGQVKFDMKNGEAIYLHDTPAKALFGQPERHESHGCVRVERALDFARLIAQADGVLDKFEEALATGDETFVDLNREIPVRLMYHTAFLGSDGTIHFADDVYGWDNDVAAALGYQRKQRPQVQHRAGDVGP